MKRILALLVATAWLMTSMAQTTPKPTIIEEIESSSAITVHYPAALAERLQTEATVAAPTEEEPAAAAAPTTATATRVGYRVLVFDDNDARTAKHQAQARSQQIQGRFPEWHTYIQFNSPYWRVKVGDFKTRSEAEGAMAAIRAAFPAYGSQLRVVRDKISHQ